MATKLLVLLNASFILVLSVSGEAPSLTFTAVPQEITPGETKLLTLSCQSSVPDQDNYTINNMAILKDGKRFAGMDIFNSTEATLENNIIGVTIKGSINDSEPNITLEWTSPPASAAGSYKCTLGFVKDDGSTGNDEKVIEIKLPEKNDAKDDNDTNITCPPRQCYVALFEDLVNILQKDELKEVSKTSDRVEDLEIDLQQMNDNKIRSQTAEMLWKDVMFKKSSPFNNKRYYLSRFQPTDAANAQSACESLGGYLAEIDDNSEYDFIRNFIDSGTGPIIPTVAILLGGTDETREGTWVYRRTGNPIGVRDWAPGQPDNTNYAGVTENCQSLVAMDGRRFQMNDVPCWTTTGRSFHFLCEVPDTAKPC